MDMARSQYFSGKDEKAIEHAKEAIEVANANPDDFGIVFEHPWAILSWAYQNLSMFEDAKQACLKRLEILESLPGEYSLQMAGALRNFADICDKTNEPEKAKQCRAKADLLNPERTETC